MAKPIQNTSTSWEAIILRDANDDILLMQWTTVPSAETWYAKWCTFLDTDVVTGTSWVYFNKWTNTSCTFELAPVASTGTFTDITATGNTVLWNAVSDTLTVKGASSIETSSASGLVVGLNWATNPALKVDASTALQATWLQITWAAAAWWVAIDVVSSGANENLTLDAKGSWTITIAGTSTGAVTITPATTITGAVTWAAAITSSGATSGVWYSTGAGDTVTQITTRATWVTINSVCWTIQTDTSSLAVWASAEFTVTNSAVAIGDVILVSQQSGSDLIAGVAGTTVLNVVTVAAGSFELSVNNLSTTTAETGAIIINFAVIKAVAA